MVEQCCQALEVIDIDCRADLKSLEVVVESIRANLTAKASNTTLPEVHAGKARWTLGEFVTVWFFTLFLVVGFLQCRIILYILKRKREGEDISDEMAEGIAKMHVLAKRTYLRYFRLEDPHSIITEIFGASFKTNNLKMYDIARGRLLGTIYQIKHNPIELGIKHVRSLIEEAGRLVITNYHVVGHICCQGISHLGT